MTCSQPNLERDAASALEPTQNLNVISAIQLIPPCELGQELPVTSQSHQAVVEGRRTINAILTGQDQRLLTVVGPCSIHDVAAAMDYAQRLAELKHRYSDRLYIVMRTYFEKPRTTIGWKGLINDPNLDGSFDMAKGLRLARKLLLDITSLGLPTGTEMLDPITPQYIDDLVSWASIGARTTESQTHRQMASGLSMPVGFKNATNGDLQIALDAMKSARNAHHFLGIDEAGRTCIVKTRGNVNGHVILRGGSGKPNYHPEHVAKAQQQLRQANLPPAVMIDCSHANSGKKFEAQQIVWQSILEQRCDARNAGREQAIVGAMLESNIHEGNQKMSPDNTAQPLRYGVSITDECLGWDKTEQLLAEAYQQTG